MKTVYSVTGMTCGGCVNRVKTTLAPLAESVEVTLEPPQVILKSATADIRILNTALAKIGHYVLYEPIKTAANAQDLTNKNTEKFSWLSTYKPLIIVFFYILLVTLAVEFTYGEFSLHRFMPNFMAGFFLVFSFFKLLDLAGFASSYAMYDLLAKRVYSYGFVYPFIELGLGIAYLVNFKPMVTNAITLAVMLFSSIGVILAVMNEQKIKCACLGSGFNLPMTTVTIIEDLLMVAMAAWMLL
ncbi:MAG: heavy-metal-associated domain-containing protein [Methylotenera sp.]|nr:heavy-metal-associated domain-containing protein [Methylotenera sp.]